MSTFTKVVLEIFRFHPQMPKTCEHQEIIVLADNLDRNQKLLARFKRLTWNVQKLVALAS